jgi:glutamate synthase domain-containing protein 3
MMITAGMMDFAELNRQIQTAADAKIVIRDCLGQRYIASGLSKKEIEITGTPGNALGAYLDGCVVRVYGNAQDATGDTMNEGTIYIHGSSGDATGYAMRGGKIFVKGNAGYRAGIHMKAFQQKIPVLVIGGTAGSFLGEYQAGGRIIVLGLNGEDIAHSCNFCATGMHGGKIFLRSNVLPRNLPGQVLAKKAKPEDLAEIEQDLLEFSQEFGYDIHSILNHDFFVLMPNSKNPYQQLYTHN